MAKATIRITSLALGGENNIICDSVDSGFKKIYVFKLYFGIGGGDNYIPFFGPRQLSGYNDYRTDFSYSIYGMSAEDGTLLFQLIRAKYGNSQDQWDIFLLNESGEYEYRKNIGNSEYSFTFSDTPSSGLSQLTVQGNNLSSVSYNNENYTTFPTTLSLDNSATTLNVNGRVSSQRIN